MAYWFDYRKQVRIVVCTLVILSTNLNTSPAHQSLNGPSIFSRMLRLLKSRTSGNTLCFTERFSTSSGRGN
ncbi:hypothetical protein BC629DRAFT_1574405 [Irpex lacteus]|nr:hypothetical protein BC629DRAFT_1574405 [Irpex lacteus]